jgi:lincosamide nucleotidyltransferase A/C/D/E
VGEHLMPAKAAADLLDHLTVAGADPCVGGGWAVDALLGEQTRKHSDLDLWVTNTDFEPTLRALVGSGVDRVLPVPGDRPWNFVVHDGGHRRVDLHVYEPLPPKSCHYGPVTAGEVFPASALCGRGVIAGQAVRCEAAERAVRWHSGYPLRAVDRHDVPLLCARFGLVLPAPYR